MNCLAYLGFSLYQMQDIECMTLVEYQLGMEAYQIQEAHRNESFAKQAWLGQQVKATTGKKNPKPVYKTFKDFYDIESIVDEIRSAYEPDYTSEKTKINRSTNVDKEDYVKRWDKILKERKREKA